jgi:hypothetical protein
MDAVHAIITVARLTSLCPWRIGLVKWALTASLGLKVILLVALPALRDTKL